MMKTRVIKLEFHLFDLSFNRFTIAHNKSKQVELALNPFTADPDKALHYAILA